MKGLCLLAIATVVCSAQEVPVSGYFRDAQGALRALQGVDGAWTAPVVIPQGVLSAGYSGSTLWYKSADELHVRADGAGWVAVPAPPGPAQAVFDSTGALAEVYFLDAGVSARWDSLAGELSEYQFQTVELAPEQISAGLFLRRNEDRLLGWRAGGETFVLPLADPPLFLLFLRNSDGTETLASDTVTFPGTSPSDTADVRFRLRNPGAAAVTISRLSVDLGAFRIVNQFFPPHILAPAAFADFSLRFAPTAGGEYSATLFVNDLRTAVRGSAVAGPLVELEGPAGWAPLTAGETAELGSVERRATLKRRLRVTPVSAATLTGAGFTLASTSDPTISEISFSSETATTATAVLSVDARRFTLRATATEFALPRPSIATPPASLEPATQQKVVIRLSEAARATVLATATLNFTPQSGQPDEPAIAILPQLLRTVSLPFAVGEREKEITFQTGTTAGSVAVRAVIGTETAEVQFTLPARPLTLTATRASNLPEVVLTGYDNRRSVSKVAFTWYLKTGQPAAPGRLEVDVATAFRDYFGQNPGGTFQLRARFPLSGTATELDGVEVELTSAQGTVQTGRLKLE
ncbi:MAG TPA: hypothetical protein VGK29_17710 [Paludibaculum sp.]|jgi:hypothetical protein